jgi:hypothetical protein
LRPLGQHDWGATGSKDVATICEGNADDVTTKKWGGRWLRMVAPEDVRYADISGSHMGLVGG